MAYRIVGAVNLRRFITKLMILRRFITKLMILVMALTKQVYTLQ